MGTPKWGVKYTGCENLLIIDRNHFNQSIKLYFRQKAQGMRSSNQLLHGDQAISEKKF